MSQSGRVKPGLLAIAGAAVLGAAVYVGVTAYGSRAPGAADPPAQTNRAPAGQERLTLDPGLFQGSVKQAYRIAQKEPALLAQLHCYCGCDRANNHKNLLDCFRDMHGASCAICVGEAIDADKLASERAPVEQIRDALRTRYANKE
jgi:Protein of unknown function with PCYCGC motif